MKEWQDAEWRKLERAQRTHAESERALETLASTIAAIISPTEGDTIQKDQTNDQANRLA
jgi:signal transduction protein with GAF and PtsI domain